MRDSRRDLDGLDFAVDVLRLDAVAEEDDRRGHGLRVLEGDGAEPRDPAVWAWVGTKKLPGATAG